MYDHKLDQLLSIKSSESHLEKFVIINAAMALSVAVTLLLSVFDFAQGEELAKALLAEIKRRKRQEAKKK